MLCRNAKEFCFPSSARASQLGLGQFNPDQPWSSAGEPREEPHSPAPLGRPPPVGLAHMRMLPCGSAQHPTSAAAAAKEILPARAS